MQQYGFVLWGGGGWMSSRRLAHLPDRRGRSQRFFVFFKTSKCETPPKNVAPVVA